MRNREIALLCRINAGGFSGERVAQVVEANGKERQILAPRHYCWKQDGQLLNIDEPPLGQSIGGLVAARRLQDLLDGSVVVTTPDGEVFAVSPDTIRPRPAKSEINPNVPV